MFQKREDKKPVFLVTGYLGSGKTTFLNELLKNQKGKRIALIVNDMGSINIDASLLKSGNVAQSDTKMIELQNGCICCTLRDEFMQQIEDLSKDRAIEAVFVEASGISEPSAIAEGFLAYAQGNEKSGIYLRSIITVVDADRIYQEFFEGLEAMNKNEETEDGQIEDDDPDILNLVMDQIEFCSCLILNKCDLLKKEELEQVKDLLRKFQSKAEIIESVQGKIDAREILNQPPFEFDQVMSSSTIQQALLRQRGDLDQNDEETGITSFVYEEKRPFNYDHWMDFLENDYPKELIRAKGYMWFLDDDMHVQLFEQAGRNASVTEMSNWVAALPEKDQKDMFANFPEVLEDWDDEYGDRLNQIVFIGKNYNEEAIRKKLEGCLENKK